MSVFKALQDAALVAQDAARLAEQFRDAPKGLLRIGKDVYCAAVDRNIDQLNAAIADVEVLNATLGNDAASAGPAFQKLIADMKQVVADLS